MVYTDDTDIRNGLIINENIETPASNAPPVDPIVINHCVFLLGQIYPNCLKKFALNFLHLILR